MCEGDSSQRGARKLALQTRQCLGHVAVRRPQRLVHPLTVVALGQDRIQDVDSGFEADCFWRHDSSVLRYGANGRQPNTSTLSTISMSAVVAPNAFSRTAFPTARCAGSGMTS